jgi:hypothetical protein
MSMKYLTKIVAASLLGDGSIRIPPEYKTACYSTAKTVPHADYLDWLTERLETLTHVRRYEIQPKNTPGALRQIHLETRSHPFYTKFRHRMYGTGVKVVDPHYLTLLDWEFMAVWFQEDGTVNTRLRRENYYDIQASIATHSFSYGDQLLLARAIQEKLELPVHIRPVTARSGARQYYLTFRRKFIPKLLDGIAPYVVPSFQYKCSYDRLLVEDHKDEEIVRSASEDAVSSGND